MWKVFVVLVAVAGGYALGYFRGHRAASILCLEEAAADLWIAPYWATSMPPDHRPFGSIPAMQLHAGINSLSEAKALLENPWRTHHKRRGSYEKVDPDTREQRIATMTRRIEEWQKLKLDLQKTSNDRDNDPPR